ncbi:hypothetical protein M8J77_015917 [Diaphorina citri]|nr:hypothetical protein M8J77_015917 [Diaphorina citri]
MILSQSCSQQNLLSKNATPEKGPHRAAASAKLVGVRSGGPAIDINQAQVHYERSPPRTRRSSASSTGSGGGTTAPPNPSLLTPSHTAARANRNRSRSPTPRLDTLSPRVDNRRSRSPTPRRNVSRSTTPDPKGRGKLDRSRSISKNREYEYRGRSASKNRDSDTSRARSVSKNRDTEASRARSVSKNRDTDYRGRSASKTRGKEGDERKFSRSDSIHSYSGLLGDDRGRSCSNDYGNSRNGSLDCTSRNGSLDYASMRNGSLDYASPRNGSLDYASTRNGSLDYALGSRNSSLDYGNTRTGHLNHTDSTESYSLPYDINLGKLRSDSCISDSLDVSKINEEISKLNRTYNIDESSFLKRTNTNEYQSGIDSTPAPRVSDNFSRTYEQVNITRPVTPIQAKSRIDSGVDTTPSMRISDNFVSSASNDSSDEGYRSLGALHNKPVNTSAPVRSVSSLSSASSKPHRSRSTGAASPSPQSSPFRRNLSSQRSGSARVNGWNKPSPAVTTENKSNTWNSRSNGVKKRPTLEETTFVEQVADIMQQYASMIPSPRKDKLSSSSSGISSTRIPAPIHQRT